MPIKKTIFDLMDEEYERRSKEREVKKKRDAEIREIGYAAYFQKVNHRNDPNILDQFAVKCSEDLKFCNTVVYVFEDHLEIERSCCSGNIVAPVNDSIRFDEIDRITVGRYGGKLLIRISGSIDFYFKEGTRYYEYCTVEHMESKDVKLTEPNQILFDCEFNEVVDEHYRIFKEIIDRYKKRKAEDHMKDFSAGQTIHYETTYHTNFYDFVINGSTVFGDVDAVINDSYQLIIKDINDRGGADKEELFGILREIESELKKLQNTGELPKKNSLFQKIMSHADKHGWFYAEVVSLIGNFVLKYFRGS